MEEIRRFTDHAAADAAASLLKSEGIDATVERKDSVMFDKEYFSLAVEDSLALRAKQLLLPSSSPAAVPTSQAVSPESEDAVPQAPSWITGCLVGALSMLAVSLVLFLVCLVSGVPCSVDLCWGAIVGGIVGIVSFQAGRRAERRYMNADKATHRTP